VSDGLETHVCVLCGRGPAAKLWLRSFIGMVIVTRIYADRGYFCQEHGVALAKNHLKRTSTLGWFSFLSILGNLVVIPVDLIMLSKAGKLAPPVGVGAQPAAIAPPPPQTAGPPPGWYTDPQGEARVRYWDGSVWTEHTAA
jgi:hypothetical protein